MTASPPSPSLDDLSGLPGGFRFAGTHCGIKRSRPDLAAIVCAPGTAAAAVVTQNPVRAPCVERLARLVPAADVRVVLVNSGNANALNGPAGAEANEAMAAEAAHAADAPSDGVLTLSTGILGVPLPVEAVRKAIGPLVAGAGDTPRHVRAFAEAILTTDTGTKVAHTTVDLPGAGSTVRILGVAKGSGMIHPNMATTLSCVCTDAAIAPAHLQTLLRRAVATTFNAITVDGDTSTNDACVVLASGASGAAVEGPDEAAFGAALTEVLGALARQVARDGEGATRLLQVDVNGAPTDEAALAVARGCCRSSLFKCSVFAGKPDWGRIAAAAGQAALEAGLAVPPEAVSITAQDVPLLVHGVPRRDVGETAMERALAAETVHWVVTIGDGPGRARAYGCDLSYDYVRINADEAAQVEVQPGGTVARNISLAAYSPRLKHQLLVDGLAYVRRFTGLRAMLYARGAVTSRFDLLASFAQDAALCLDAGIRAVAVLPAGEPADTFAAAVEGLGHPVRRVPAEPAAIADDLFRGRLCLVEEPHPDPGPYIDLAVSLGIQKLIVLGDDQGLSDPSGTVSQLGPELLLDGMERGRFTTRDPEFPVIARQAAVRQIPSVHLIDGRMPHALVGELFTRHGIGTLITRQAVS